MGRNYRKIIEIIYFFMHMTLFTLFTFSCTCKPQKYMHITDGENFYSIFLEIYYQQDLSAVISIIETDSGAKSKGLKWARLCGLVTVVAMLSKSGSVDLGIDKICCDKKVWEM